MRPRRGQRLLSYTPGVVLRRLFNFATAVSLTVFIATAALWVRSYHAWDRWAVTWPYPHTFSSLESWRGTLKASHLPRAGVSWGRDSYWSQHGFVLAHTHLHLREMRTRHATAPPSIMSGPAWFGYVIGVPHWFIAALTTAFPAAYLRRRFRARHLASGLCPACGYDLRATPDRCPECGTATPTRSAPSTPSASGG